MRLDEITVFINVLEAGSFAAAAKRLGMPATTVSAKVAALEKRLGFTLIRRTTRKLHATLEGRRYFERCRTALHDIKSIEAELRAASSAMDGVLRLTASVDIAQTLLPPIIVAFHGAHPRVGVDLVVTDRVADLVADEIDLAIRVGPLRDSSLITRAFVTGPSGLFASRSYLDRMGMPASVEDLRQHDFISLRKSWAQPLTLLRGKEKIKLDLSSGVACDDLLTARALAAMGLGICFLPGYLAQQLDLARVLPELSSPFTGLYFAYPAQAFVPARVSEFISCALTTVKRLEMRP
mgnify:CR=1 FL=1